MADVPSPLTYGTVVGRFVHLWGDTSDAGLTPDEIPATGYVTFMPKAEVVRGPISAPPFVGVKREIKCPVLNGWLCQPGSTADVGVDPAEEIRGVRLVASDSPGIQPSPMQYDVTFYINNATVQPPDITIEVPADGSLDLATVVPSSTPGVVTVVLEDVRYAAEAAAEAAALSAAAAATSADEASSSEDSATTSADAAAASASSAASSATSAGSSADAASSSASSAATSASTASDAAYSAAISATAAAASAGESSDSAAASLASAGAAATSAAAADQSATDAETALSQMESSVDQAVADYMAANPVPDADASTKGLVQLAGDLSGTAEAPTVPALANKSDVGHTHDDRYFTETEADARYVLEGDTRLSDARTPVVHTHTSTEITDFVEAAQDAVAAMLSSGANVTLTYDDSNNTLVVEAAGDDVELMRDTIGAALVGINGVSIVVNDAADTITFSLSGVSIAQITGLQTALDAKSDTSHTHTIDDLSDVDVSAATEGQVLAKGAGGSWIPADQLGGGGGASTLGELTDVDTTGAVSGEALVFDGTSWSPGAAASGDTSGQFSVNVVADAGASLAIPATYPAHDVTMTENCTLSFDSPTDGHAFILWLSGAFTPTWPASVVWDGGVTPTYDSAGTRYSFVTLDGGTAWLGGGPVAAVSGSQVHVETVTIPTGWTSSTDITVPGLVDTDAAMIGPVDSGSEWGTDWEFATAADTLTVAGTAPDSSVSAKIIWWV